VVFIHPNRGHFLHGGEKKKPSLQRGKKGRTEVSLMGEGRSVTIHWVEEKKNHPSRPKKKGKRKGDTMSSKKESCHSLGGEKGKGGRGIIEGGKERVSSV